MFWWKSGFGPTFTWSNEAWQCRCKSPLTQICRQPFVSQTALWCDALCGAVYSVPCTVYSVQCTDYSVQCTVYSVQCTDYSVQNTVYSVQCTEYSLASWQHLDRESRDLKLLPVFNLFWRRPKVRQGTEDTPEVRSLNYFWNFARLIINFSEIIHHVRSYSRWS